MRNFPRAEEAQDRRTVAGQAMPDVADTAYMVWLLDVSGSMVGPRIAELKRMTTVYQKDVPYARLILFATTIEEVVSLDNIPEPHGGTNLHLALDRAAELMAGKTMVFTDGEPADAEACFVAAARIPGVVEVFFCGDKGDREAIKFCEKLSRDNGGGGVVVKDVEKGQSLICDEVRECLGLPAPIAL